MKKISLIFFLLLIFVIDNFAKGEWEIGLHYSSWSLNLAKPYIEETVEDSFDNFDSSKGDIVFDSAGNNYGIDVRYYPAGKYGSFSLGLSYEKNNFKGDLTGNYTDYDEYGNKAEVNAVGLFDLQPHSFNFSLRWDIAPRYRIHPYFDIGFGLGKMDGLMNLTTTTKTYIGSSVITDKTTEEKTLDDLIKEYEEEEGKPFPISFFPIVHISFGIKGEITNNIYFIGEVAFYDGMIFRGGIAFKF